MNRAVFLDRDGVITQDPPHYAHRIDQLKLIPRTIEAIKLLNKNKFKVIVVSNQSGVGRGYFKENNVDLFNRALEEKLYKYHSFIDAIYYCPHHPKAKIGTYRVECDCRKPKPGMLLKGANDYNINLKKSFMIGDKWSDILAGQAVGCKTILVLTGHGNDQLQTKKLKVDFISKRLYESVVDIIIKKDYS
jgi:D-glycero-D-manno-heptose 1,7-bisphosphate phosphatase